MNHDREKLRIEFLESRVLLSAVGPAESEATSQSILDTAVRSDSGSVDVELLPFGEVLIITGPGSGNLSLDLDLLPTAVVNLQISSFSSVELTGAHAVNSLTLSDIAFIDAGRISIGGDVGLTARNVEHIKIDTAPALIVLQGHGEWGSVGEKTLLEVGQFSSPADAFILAWVKNLGLATPSHVESLPQIVSYPSQSILLNFQPDSPIRVTTEGTVVVVKGGDFARYFLASTSERASLEQSLLIARQTAETDFVPLSGLLGNAFLQAALGELLEGEATASRPLTLSDVELAQIGQVEFPGPGETNNTFIALEPDAPAPSATGIALLSPVPDMGPDSEDAGSSTRLAQFGISAPAPLEFTFDDLRASQGPEDVDIAMLRPSVPEPTEGFGQLLLDLRPQLTTFGDLLNVRVSNHFRFDHQLALLAEARPGRSRDFDESSIVSV